MTCMTKKNDPLKKRKLNDRITIRLDEEAKENIQSIQTLLADSVRGQLSVTDAVHAALRVTKDKLKATPK